MRLRVATLNAWALPSPLGHQVAARIEAIGAQLPRLDLDVLGFQEVWTGAARAELIRAGRGAGLVHAWHREETFAGSGLLVLSRFPIRSAHFVAYRLGGLPQQITQLDYYGGKGFVLLELETPSGPVTVIDTHLQARYGSQVSHEYRGHRTGQVVQLARAVRRTSQPVVVLGDFNFKQRHAEYSIWTGLAGVADSAATFGATAPTVFPGNPYRGHSSSKRIDYIFLRDGRMGRWRTRRSRRVFDETFRIDGERATFSDHAGVVAELELEARPGIVPPVRPGAVKRAVSELSAGRQRAQTRRTGHRTWTGAALAAAAVGAVTLQTPALSRRGFLRGAVRAVAFGGAAPGVAISLFSELWTPEELGAFADLHGELVELSHEADAIAGGAAPALDPAAFTTRADPTGSDTNRQRL